MKDYVDRMLFWDRVGDIIGAIIFIGTLIAIGWANLPDGASFF